jgi:hypothetical protein
MPHPQRLNTYTTARREHEATYRGDAHRPGDRPLTLLFPLGAQRGGDSSIVGYWASRPLRRKPILH